MLEQSYYHRTVRSLALLTALLLSFDSGVLIPDTKILSDTAFEYLANTVGVMAVVPQNEINSLSAELSARSAELDRREREIDARATDTVSNDSTMVLSFILLILLVLIVINYILDYLRLRRTSRVPQKVSLSSTADSQYSLTLGVHE